MRPPQLDRKRTGGDAGEEQRNADPDHDGRGTEYQRLEQNPQRAEHQQDAAENGPARSGNLHGVHVAAQTDGAESAQHEPETEENRQRGGRKRDVEDQDDAEDDFDDAPGQHPAAARDEVFVGRRKHDFENARKEHQPAEYERHAQITLGGVDEYQNAHDEQGDADDQEQPPVTYGPLRIFDQ